jgi:hypothetical protein
MGEIAADIDRLNALLRGERAAVEAYDECLKRVNVPSWLAALWRARRSHVERVGLLARRIEDLGGVPASGAGAWGRFARWVEAGARVFGPASALAALEGGEEYGKEYYERALPRQVSVETRAFVAIQLLPEQCRTLCSLRELRGRSVLELP